MDHLPLPSRPAISTPRVQYVCEEPYDGGSFLSYPTRAGWHQDQQQEGHLRFLAAELNSPSENVELQKRLQSWLFFGLLHELLAPWDLYNSRDYIETDPNGQRFVHTKGLPEKLQLWLQRVQSLSDGEKLNLQMSLMGCLKIASEALLCLAEQQHPDFEFSIKMSLLSICETISGLGQFALDMDSSTQWPKYDFWAKIDYPARKQMLDNGWCPSVIKVATRTFSSPLGHFYVQHLPKPNLGIDHYKCTDHGCQQLQIDPAKYQTRHVKPGCHSSGCKPTGPSLADVAKCLRDSTFPVLKIVDQGSGRFAIEVIPYSDGTTYVALSHVWVVRILLKARFEKPLMPVQDGMGNQTAIELPECQIPRLYHLLQGIRGRTFTLLDGSRKKETRELYIWCDTLCCPVEKGPDGSELKNLAMGKLREVYQKADYVLVLDRSMELVSVAGLEPLEVAAHMLTSRWMQRLWVS